MNNPLTDSHLVWALGWCRRGASVWAVSRGSKQGTQCPSCVAPRLRSRKAS